MLRRTLWLAVFIPAIQGQQAAPAFEVASIRPSESDSGSSGIRTGHGRLDGINVTLKRCIVGAYGIGPQQIAGGPDWLDSRRFQIMAKAAQPESGDAALMVMLQGLLADRFHLVLHRESRLMPAYVLEVARNGPKLEKADAGSAATNTSTNQSGVVLDAHPVAGPRDDPEARQRDRPSAADPVDDAPGADRPGLSARWARMRGPTCRSRRLV